MFAQHYSGTEAQDSRTITIPDLETASKADDIRPLDMKPWLFNGKAAVYWTNGTASYDHMDIVIVWRKYRQLHT